MPSLVNLTPYVQPSDFESPNPVTRDPKCGYECGSGIPRIKGSDLPVRPVVDVVRARVRRGTRPGEATRV